MNYKSLTNNLHVIARNGASLHGAGRLFSLEGGGTWHLPLLPPGSACACEYFSKTLPYVIVLLLLLSILDQLVNALHMRTRVEVLSMCVSVC